MLESYSKIPLDPNKKIPSPHSPTSKRTLPSKEEVAPSSYSPKNIFRPIQYIYVSWLYPLSWGVTVGILLSVWLLLSATEESSVFQIMTQMILNPRLLVLLWCITFLSQWGTHCVIAFLKHSVSLSPKVYQNSGFLSQVMFMGLVDFCMTGFVTGMIYMAWVLL